MQFFTPELYLRFNSPDDNLADRADEEWESAIEQYNRRLTAMRDQMPQQVQALTELPLHDTELLASDLEFEPVTSFAKEFGSGAPFWLATAVFSLKQADRVVTLFYILWDHVRQHPPQPDWPFSKLRKHWLYDEIDAPENSQGRFFHRILFSDGSVTEIPFINVMIHTIPGTTADKRGASRKSA